MTVTAPATLNIREQRGASGWVWTFADTRGTHTAEVEFDVTSPGNQVLLERAGLSDRMPGMVLRSQLTRSLRALLGDVTAEAIATCEAPFLHVRGLGASHLALSLPFELIFRPEEPGRVVRFVTRLYRPESSRPAADLRRRLFAAFALRAEDPYLPLHAEASALTLVAREARMAYDELFLALTAEDILSAGRDSLIVHLAGHGSNGRFGCHWRARETAVLTSYDLIDAWKDVPPRLVVLDFCESSSEAEALRLAEANMTGSLALHAYAEPTYSLEPAAPTSSMALDLVGSLPTAVLALRTTADDAQAREFVGAFYSAHLVNGLSLEEAFARAVAERGFHDDAGLQVPCLYVSEEQPEALRAGWMPSDEAAPVRSLGDRQRRCLNSFYKAIGPLGQAMGQTRICSITGDIGDSRDLLTKSLTEVTDLWNSITADDDRPEPTVRVIDDCHHLVQWTHPGEGPIAGIDIDLECLPSGLAIGELLTSRRGLAFADLLLVAQATCDVPAIVEAAVACDVGAIAKRLNEVAASRSPLTDRTMRWDLASELIDCLPADYRATVRTWSDDKWEKLQTLGPLAIDIFASRFLLGELHWMLDTTARALDYMVNRLDLNPEVVWAKLSELISAGLGQRGIDVVADGVPPTVSFDLLTAARAWAACSDAAAGAFLEHAIDRDIAYLGLDHKVAGLATGPLASLAEVCLSVGDPRAGRLLAELAARDDGAQVATELRERADTTVRHMMDGYLAVEVRDAWQTLEGLYDVGRLEDARGILDEIALDPDGVDHPLRIATTRLAMADLSPSDLLTQASDIERQLEALLAGRSVTGTDLDLLLMARQLKAEAMRDLGATVAAAEILRGHFVQARSMGARQSQLVAAGGIAVAALAEDGAVASAREIWAGIVELVYKMHPSAEKVMALTAEVRLLLQEGRSLRAHGAAETLLDEIAACRKSKPTVIRRALRVCMLVFSNESRGLALMALLRMCDAAEQETDALRQLDHMMVHEIGQLSREDLLSAASELAQRVPLESLGVSADAYMDRIPAYFEELLELEPMTPGEMRLGAPALHGLASRAGDGCRLSETILLSLGTEGAGGGPPRACLNPPRGVADLQRLARDHAPLSELLAHLVNDAYALANPLAAIAYSGVREAQLTLMGLMIGDLQRELNPAVASALLALGAGDEIGAQRALGPERDNLELLCNACVTVEHCCLSDPANREVEVDPALVRFARSAWQTALNYAWVGRRSGRAALVALACAMAAPGELMNAMAAGREDGKTLQEMFGVGHDEPLTAEILDWIDANPEVQLGLAAAALEDDEPVEEAIPVLERLADSASGTHALSAGHVLLRFHVRRDREGASSRQAMSASVDRLRPLLANADPGFNDTLEYLGTLSEAGFRTGRFDVALEANRAALAVPTTAMTPRARQSYHFNYAQAAHLDGGATAGARALGEAGAELGFLGACVIFGSSGIDPNDESSLPYAETLASLGSETGTDPPTDQLDEGRLRFLAVVEGAAGWTNVAAIVRADTEGE